MKTSTPPASHKRITSRAAPVLDIIPAIRTLVSRNTRHRLAAILFPVVTLALFLQVLQKILKTQTDLFHLLLSRLSDPIPDQLPRRKNEHIADLDDIQRRLFIQV
jgi:hypothetical protein